MNKNEKLLGYLKAGAAVICGNLLYAMTVKFFLLPAGLVTGGTTGIALTVAHFSGISVSLFVLCFNVLMLFLGLWILGKQFALTTLASTFLYPLFLEGLERIFPSVLLTEDLLLCTLFSGLGIGIALGIVIRAGASTGGMDIPPLLLRKFFKIPVSVSIYAFDFVILLLQALFRPAENILYGILLVLVYTLVLDKVLVLGKSRIELKIISKKSNEISKAIQTGVDRGVTLLKAEGGYLREETTMIFSVVSNRELYKIERILREIDPESFMVVSHVSEVRGRGFSMGKHYR